MNYKFKTTNIKGKEYVEVNEHIKYFRLAEEFKGWSLTTEMVHWDENLSAFMKAFIADPNGYIRATGFAQEDKSRLITLTRQAVENCGNIS